MLARRWRFWLAAALGSLLLWMALTALAMRYSDAAPIGLQVVVGLSFAAACASGCFFVIATCLRFAAGRSRMLDSFARNAFGMYVFHYIFVVWLQYALLGVALFAIAKAAIVFGGTVLLAWTATMAMGFVPFGARLIGAEPRAPVRAAALAANLAARTPR
jgi:surface polysaccharide O-acyltransferase-like enzyme